MNTEEASVPSRDEEAKWVKTQLLEFIDSAGEGAFGLTAKKVYEREIRLAEDPIQKGLWICEIERHGAIGGCTYTKGLPMCAYQTYVQRLNFDPVAKNLSEIDEKHIDCHFNISALAEEHLRDSAPQVYRKESWKLKIEVRICSHQFSVETTSLKLACKKVEDFFRGWRLDFFFEALDISTGEKKRLESQLSDSVVEEALRILKSNWEDPETIEE